MITADTYSKDMDMLRTKIGALQKDLSEVIGAVGQLSGHGLEDLREEAAAGTDALEKQGRQIQAALYRGASQVETSIESAIRQQPALAIALATTAIVLAVSPLIARRH
tara:strand:- start:7215 stop:7538 length:324 start_codon:yes stop_codon:yes gene_type:complete